VHEAVQKNSLCETSPNKLHEGQTYEKIMDLRPRNRSKEINGDFRYQPKTNVEKVIHSVAKRGVISSVLEKEFLP